MQKHLEFQIVTPRTLAEFKGKTLVLPDVRVLNDEEQSQLKQYVSSGRTLIITGHDETQLGETNGQSSAQAENVIRFPQCPGADYAAKLKSNFNATTPDEESSFLDKLKPGGSVKVIASPAIATSIARVDGAPHIFFANFAGLRGGVNPLQTPQKDVRVQVAGSSNAHGFFLPFMGEVSSVKAVEQNGEVTFTLPAIDKGAVFWWTSDSEAQAANHGVKGESHLH